MKTPDVSRGGNTYRTWPFHSLRAPYILFLGGTSVSPDLREAKTHIHHANLFWTICMLISAGRFIIMSVKLFLLAISTPVRNSTVSHYIHASRVHFLEEWGTTEAHRHTGPSLDMTQLPTGLSWTWSTTPALQGQEALKIRGWPTNRLSLLPETREAKKKWSLRSGVDSQAYHNPEKQGTWQKTPDKKCCHYGYCVITWMVDWLTDLLTDFTDPWGKYIHIQQGGTYSV